MEDAPYQYESVFPAITDVVSGNRDKIVLVYGNSNDNTYNALAFRVLRSSRRIERVEDAFSLADGETKDFGYFGSAGFSRDVPDTGDELFGIEQDRSSTLVEYGFGVPQDGVYVAVQTGDGSVVSGLNKGDERLRGLDANGITQRAGVLSDYTTVNTPAYTQSEPMPTTALAERENQGLVRMDSDQSGRNRFFFAFNNVSGGQVTVDLTGYGATYNVTPIESAKEVRRLIRNTGDPNVRMLNYGGFGNTNPNLPTEWFDNRVRVEDGEVTSA